MTVFIFELSGKFAHWRKFYTNSSSLTYYFPTRTNITGILASILRMERDSYYEIFNKDNLDIGINIKSKVKRKITCLNYLDTRSSKYLKSYTQIKFELLMPLNIRKERIKYNIFLRPKDDITKEKLKELITLVENKDFGYGIYLGQRPFIANIFFIKSVEEKKVEKAKEVMTACLKENIKGKLDFSDSFYVSDIIPIDFNKNREIRETKEVIYNLNGPVKITDGYIDNVYDLNSFGNITFM